MNNRWAVISTWKMSQNGCAAAAELLGQGGRSGDAVVRGIQDVEDNPDFHSVGFGGLPDEEGNVSLDGGFMDGDTLRFGAVASIQGFRSPILIARSLIQNDRNNFLRAKGAEDYARMMGFEERNNLTEEIRERWKKERGRDQKLTAYDGHDTVCFAALDCYGTVSAGVSTSGLYLKKPGRIGDSPVVGSGFYADSRIGAAGATGVGEEIMKGVLSYQALQMLRCGKSAQEAAETAVKELTDTLVKRNGHADAMSLILLSKDGSFGVGTNIRFPFVFADDHHSPQLYLAQAHGSHCMVEPVMDADELTED